MKIVIGILRESKIPVDNRVILSPSQCKWIMEQYGHILQLFVQSSQIRCYSDKEYEDVGVPVQDCVAHCDILLGVKEVKMNLLIPNRTYFIFSHTAKRQSYNRKLLQEILKLNIRLIDYEKLVNQAGKRVIAFGRWAGIAGAHNTIAAYGFYQSNNLFKLPRLYECTDFDEAKQFYHHVNLKNVKIIVTGTGRVGSGIKEVLNLLGVTEVSTEEFLVNNNNNEYENGCFIQLGSRQTFAKGSNDDFDSDFYTNPSIYHSILSPYLKMSDILINGIYWDVRAPQLFTRQQMLSSNEFKIKIIGDITCDIAPISSIPCTIRPSTISEPYFVYDPQIDSEVKEKNDQASLLTSPRVVVMAVDNLPNELPRDASADFGDQFIRFVLPELLHEGKNGFGSSDMLYFATIARNGKLNKPFYYLEDFVKC